MAASDSTPSLQVHEKRPDALSSASNDTKCYSEVRLEKKSPRDMGTLSWICVVISLLFSMFLFSLDNVIVADIQPSIINTLGNIDKLPWVSVGYALGATAVNLFVSKLFSQFDNKIIFLAGVLVFEIGSAVCGAAPSMTALIFGRVICGVGAVGIYVGNMNLLSVLTTEAERPLYLSFVGLTWGLGTILGPVIGGAFTDGSATWRWSFYLNLCVGAVVAPVYIFLIPSHNPRPGLGVWSRTLELDWAGAILCAGAYTSLVMAIAFGGAVYAWNSGQIVGLFVCAGVLWISFAIQQALSILTTKENRLLPFAILRSWEMHVFFAQIAAAVTAVYVPMYFIPIYFQFVRHTTALQAAVRLLPFVILNVFGILLNGAVMSKFGFYMPWYLFGGILTIIGGALLTLTGIDTSTSVIYGYSALIGLGSGFFVQASFPISQAKVSAHEIPLAVAYIGCGQITGITFALTISNSVFLNEATAKIRTILPSESRSTVQNAISGVDSSFLAALNQSDRVRSLHAITDSVNNVYLMVVAAGALAIVLSLFMKRERLFLQPESAMVAQESGKA